MGQDNDDIILAEGDDIFKKFIDHAGDGIAIVQQKKILYANKAFADILGYSVEEMKNSDYDDFVVTEVNPENKNLVESVGIRKDCSKVSLDIRMGVGPYGERPAYFIIHRDMTHHKRAEAKIVRARQMAEEANRMKSVFLANMSHELRTPLNAIINYSEMLIEDAEDAGNNDCIPDLEKIYTSGRRLIELINDILDISKIQAGKMELQLEDIELSSLINDIRTSIEPLAKKNGNTFIAPDNDLGTLRADRKRLQQVLFNLLSNACKFTSEGTVTLDVSNNDQWILFDVKDTGIGIPKEHIQELFQPFGQLDDSSSRRFDGSGLGLIISKELSKLMGGDVTVESEPGEGSTFSVRLPL